jgi:NADPH:quinone reductase-like Zn-dependent oxidoreductase
MRAAVVTSFSMPPTCRDFPAPTPRAPDEVLVDVIAAGLHPRVRSQADGSHYTSSGELPLVPGIDGVGRGRDGILRYFILPDTTMGAMAEQTVVNLRRSFVLAEDSDPVLIAAAMNPAMSSWVALRRRISFRPGQSVLVLGAIGNAGQLAVQIARHLGAGHVIGAGRQPERLAALTDLGVDVTVSLDGTPEDVGRRLGQAARDVDVVIDYLWGQPTADAMRAIVMNRSDPGLPLTWIEVGSVAGLAATIPSAALRAARLQIVGSGQGSVPARDFLAELPDLAAEITSGTFRIDARAVPLTDVETAWKDTGSRQRIVITPRPLVRNAARGHRRRGRTATPRRR